MGTVFGRERSVRHACVLAHLAAAPQNAQPVRAAGAPQARDTGVVAPHEHIVWFEDNIAWFESLGSSTLDQAVPNCPDWTVVDVLNHLSFGLGLAYPAAVVAAPTTSDERVFADVAWPSARPVGTDAVRIFGENLRSCAELFRETDPAAPCWTYAGPSVAAFWFRRAAIETALHRLDVEDALDAAAPLADDRAEDAILETLSFAFPFAATLTDAPTGQLVVESPCLTTEARIGAGTPTTVLRGEPTDVVNALWGRNLDRVSIDGDAERSGDWLHLIEVAFAGR